MAKEKKKGLAERLLETPAGPWVWAAMKMNAKSAFNTQMRMDVYRQIAGLIGQKVQLRRIMEAIEERRVRRRGRADPIGIVMNQWLEAYRGSGKFSTSVKGWIPETERMTISAGEEAGKLQEALGFTIEAMEGSREITEVVVKGTLGPLALLSMAVAILFAFSFKMIPMFETVSNPKLWYGVAGVVRDMAAFVRGYMIPLVTGIVVLMVAISLSLSRLTGSVRIALDKIPPWSIYRILQGARFFNALSVLIKAKVSFRECLIRLRGQANPYLRERIVATLDLVRAGHNPGDALAENGYDFPDADTADNLSVLAELPNFNEELSRIGKTFLKDAKRSVERQTKFVNRVLGLFVVAISLTMLAGVFSIQEQVTAQMERIKK